MIEKKRGGLKVPINEAALIPQVAALLALGKTTTAIAQDLNLGYNTVKRLSGLEDTKALVKDIGDSAMAVAKAVIKRRVGDSVDLACEVLKEHLDDERSLEAVKLVFKVAGALTDEPANQNQGAGTIQVIMPGAHAEKAAVEVTSFELEPPSEV